MRSLDEQYPRTPFYGSPKRTLWLGQQGYRVNRKRVARLMRLMGLVALYPKKRTSQAAPGPKVYPYRLRNLTLDRVNQVWSTDIPYMRLRGGFL